MKGIQLYEDNAEETIAIIHYMRETTRKRKRIKTDKTFASSPGRRRTVNLSVISKGFQGLEEASTGPKL